MGRRAAGGQPGGGLPATLSRHRQRDGGAFANAAGETPILAVRSAVVVTAKRRLPLPQHLRAKKG